MKSIKVCEYSRSRSFHYDLILQDQASGERSQDQWSSGFNNTKEVCLAHSLSYTAYFGHYLPIIYVLSLKTIVFVENTLRQ